MENTTLKRAEEFEKAFDEKFDSLECDDPYYSPWINSKDLKEKFELKDIKKFFLSQLSLSIKEAREEERQFILNILDGIDIADEQMGNKGGGTKAIRFALQSRQ